MQDSVLSTFRISFPGASHPQGWPEGFPLSSKEGMSPLQPCRPSSRFSQAECCCLKEMDFWKTSEAAASLELISLHLSIPAVSVPHPGSSWSESSWDKHPSRGWLQPLMVIGAFPQSLPAVWHSTHTQQVQSDLQVTPEGSGHSGCTSPTGSTQLNPYIWDADAKNPHTQHQNPSWALQEESGVWGTEMWRSSLCEGFSSSYPAIPEHQGSVFSCFRKYKNPTWISSGKRGRAGSVQCQQARCHCPQGMP